MDTTTEPISLSQGAETTKQNKQKQEPRQEDKGGLIARSYNSGFHRAHDTYNAISRASDGRIYYVLSSDALEEGGRMYVYDPKTDGIRELCDLTALCGEQGRIPQGKSHVRFYEWEGKLYFSTHVGYYELIKGMDRLPRHPPRGYGAYAGGAYPLVRSQDGVL